MKSKRHKFFSRRLQLILSLGCLSGLALGLFGQHVESMSDDPLGPTPLSWKFKPITSRLAAVLENGAAMQDKNQKTSTLLPGLDQAPPAETALACFALG
jgi:hypothetical protein